MGETLYMCMDDTDEAPGIDVPALSQEAERELYQYAESLADEVIEKAKSAA